MEVTRKAAAISVGASVFILALKFWAYAVTDSTALLSDALESIVNVLAAIVALQVVRVVARPPDEDHPYGHGKFEYFSMAFEGGLITFAGIMIAGEAGRAFYAGTLPRNVDLGLWIAVGAAVLNLVLGLYLLMIGRKYQTEALRASGVHVLTDVGTTVGAIAGLALVRITGISWFDPAAALVIAGLLIYSGYKIVRQAAAGLIDEVEPAALAELTRAFEKNRQPGIIDIHLLRMIRSGRFHHVDAHLVVPEFWDVSKTHAVSDEFEKAVVASYAYDGEIAFHIDPCFREYCEHCALLDCPIRRKEFRERRPFTVQAVTHAPIKDLM